MRTARHFWIGLLLACTPSTGPAAEPPPSRVLIIVGLPGDPPHDAKWAKTLKIWLDWLTGPCGFARSEIRLLAPSAVATGTLGPATRESIAREVAELRRDLKPEGRLWVFWLGHTSLEGENVSLHLPGPDLLADEFGALFTKLACQEQVFWMTSAGSGWLTRPLKTPGRIVISATTREQEFNETEFPQALASLVVQPLKTLDANHDGRVSLLELFQATADATVARYESTKRVPTEHPQLDDNGDGIGTERPDLADPTKPSPKPLDGALAAKTFLPG